MKPIDPNAEKIFHHAFSFACERATVEVIAAISEGAGIEKINGLPPAEFYYAARNRHLDEYLARMADVDMGTASNLKTWMDYFRGGGGTPP